MHLVIFQLIFVATLIVSSLAVPGNLTVGDVSHPQCPFNAEASIVEDGSYLDIVYSTKDTTPNSLAEFGSGVNALNSKRKCYVVVSIKHNDQNVARLKMTGLEITGNVRLDEGLVAKIETSFVLSGNPYSLMNFTTASISGPKNSNFTYRADLPSPELHADCHSPKSLTLISVFSISAQSSSVPSSVTGELVKGGTLRKRVFLKWIDLCEVVTCRWIDRYGNVVFQPPYDAETCPENWLH